MSRGPGALQQEILDVVRQAPVPVFRNRLMWMLAEKRNSVTRGDRLGTSDIYEGRISPSFDRQFRKSATSMVKKGWLLKEERKVRNLPEFIDLHPHHTTLLEVRDLRMRLLGSLRNPSARFEVGDNEEYITRMRRAAGDDDLLQELREEWCSCRAALLQRAAKVGDRQSEDLLLEVIARGWELFDPASPLGPRVKCRVAFTKLAAKLEADGSPLLPSERQQLAALRERAFPGPEMRGQHVKSRIMSLGHFGEGRVRIHDMVKRELHREHQGLIESLPGFRPREGQGFLTRRRAQYPPLLDKLLDRNGFRELVFYRPPA